MTRALGLARLLELKQLLKNKEFLMKQLAAIIITLLAATTFANTTTTVAVEGMHCSGCKKMIEAKVCGDEAIAKNAASCEVKLVDEEKQTGEVVIVAKPDTTVDAEAVKKQILAAGSYTVAKVTNTETVIQPAAATAAVVPAEKPMPVKKNKKAKKNKTKPVTTETK